MILPKNLYFKWLYEGGRSENGRQWHLPTGNQPGKKMPKPKGDEKYSFCNPTWFITWMRNHLFVAEVLDAEMDSSNPDIDVSERDYLGTDARLLFEIETFEKSLAFKFACDCIEHALSSKNINPSVESYLKAAILQLRECTESLDSIGREAEKYLKTEIDEGTREWSAFKALFAIVKGVRCLKESTFEWYSYFNSAAMFASEAVPNQKEEWTWQTNQFSAYIRPELEERLKSYHLSQQEE